MDEFIKKRINILFQNIENIADSQTAEKILEENGKYCLRNGLWWEKVIEVKKLIDDKKNINKILSLFNERNVGGGKLTQKGNTIIGYYDIKCPCPIKNEMGIDSRLFCKCTQGWIKEAFETILEQKVTVKLTKTQVWGDSICEFIVEM